MFLFKVRSCVSGCVLVFLLLSGSTVAGAMTAAEYAELGTAIAKCPVLIAAQKSLIKGQQKKAAALMVLADVLRIANEFLALHNKPEDRLFDQRFIMVGESFLLLFDLMRAMDAKDATDLEKLFAKFPQEESGTTFLKTVVLPCLESGTAVYIALNRNHDEQSCNRRALCSVGAFLSRIAAGLLNSNTKNILPIVINGVSLGLFLKNTRLLGVINEL